MNVHRAGGALHWAVVREPAPEAPPAVFEWECTTCGHTSGATEDGQEPQRWAVRHAVARPQHTGFREIRHCFWRARPEVLRAAGA